VPGSAFFPVGTQFNIVQTATGTPQSGTNGSVLIVVDDPTNPLFTFEPVPLAGTVNGLVAIVTTGIPLLVPLAPPPGVPLPPTVPIAAGAALALLGSTQTPDIISIEAAINTLSNPVAVVNALTQLAPSAPDVPAPLVTFQGARQFQDLWLQRMDEAMCGEVDQRRPDDAPQMCRRNEPQSGGWVKAFGNFGEQGATGSFLGYNSRVAGTMVGYDAPLLRDEPAGVSTRGGIGIGYAHTAIDGKTFTANTNFDTYQATAYITHERGPWFVQGDVSFGWNNYSGTRSILLPGISRVASASYGGQSYTAFANTGYISSRRASRSRRLPRFNIRTSTSTAIRRTVLGISTSRSTPRAMISLNRDWAERWPVRLLISAERWCPRLISSGFTILPTRR
jgi:uncharacterized protein with beta-barrel porin domain